MSRLSMPLEARREDISLDLETALQLSDELGRLGPNRNELGDRLSAFRDDDALLAHAVEKREALFLELRRRDLFHGHIMALVMSTDHAGRGHGAFRGPS